MTKTHFLLLLLLITGTGQLLAQSGKVRGFIYEKATDAPIPFANVSLEGTSIGAVANDEGYFLLNDVPVGTYTIKVSFVGFQAVERQIKVEEGRIVSETFYLEQASEVLESVEVSAERQARETKVLTSVVSLDPKEIAQFSVGGDADIMKALQVLPGVVTTGDQGGQLYIRGGAPIQNLILLDGMVVYNPFHSIGFFSVFDADIIRSADVYTGGFNAEYGSRNSAVMDVRTRDGNRKRFAGKVSASTYTAKALLEMPLGTKDEKGRAATSVLFSARTSYLDQSSSIFYPYVETQYEGLPFNFRDIYGKITSQSDNGSKVSGFGFSFTDAVRFGGDNSIDWDAVGGGIKFTAVPPASSVLISGDFSYSAYEITAVQGGGSVDFSSINSFNGGLDFTYFLRENDELKYGIEAIGYGTNLDLDKDFGTNTSVEDNTTELGAYMQYKFATERLLLEPGFRVHYYSSQSEVSLEPRLGLKYNINEWLRVKAAAGLYSQNLMAANSDRDVVNLFYGFLSGPDNVPDQFRGETLNSDLQKAQHLVTGVEVELSQNLTLNLEGYLKYFSQLTNTNRNQLYPPTNRDPDIPEIYKSEFIVERGLARGIDLLAKYRTRKLYLWAAYSLSKVTRDDGIREYAPFFDRRHNLNLVGTYNFGKDNLWEASLRYNFGTGFPFTPQRAYFRKQPFLDPQGNALVSYDYTTRNGELEVLYGELNTKRLPNYHRVDASIRRTFEIGEYQELEVSAGATNLLNYENIFYYDRIDNERVNQLPIMPTLSLSYSF